jgi:hypothetical protein
MFHTLLNFYVLSKYFAISNLHEKKRFTSYPFGNHRIFINFEKNDIRL